MTHKLNWVLSCLTVIVLLFLTTPAAIADQRVNRLLYVTVPDGAGGSKNKPGIYVFDIDGAHKLVKHIAIPDMGGTRGVGASAATAKFWYSHRNTNLACMDLITEKKVWDLTYDKSEGGADRFCVTPDGKKLYVTAGWWSGNTYMKIVDGQTGKLLKKIEMPWKGGHNTIMNLDGTRMYWGSINHGYMCILDTATDEIIKKVGPFKGRVSPYTINGTETLCFVNSRGVRFEVGDLRSGRVLHDVVVREKNFSHGVGMTPDETEVWLADPGEKKLWVYDATVMPPKLKQSIAVSYKSHGWITFSIDGAYAYPDTGDVIDPKTKQIIATLTDAGGKSVRSSKFIEIHFRGGRPVRVGNQFGIGRVTDKAAK